MSKLREVRIKTTNLTARELSENKDLNPHPEESNMSSELQEKIDDLVRSNDAKAKPGQHY
jgi:hypothetical protein